MPGADASRRRNTILIETNCRLITDSGLILDAKAVMTLISDGMGSNCNIYTMTMFIVCNIRF